MTQQKDVTRKPRSNDKTSETSSLKNDPNKPRYEVKPEFWDSIFDSLPPWLDEISAIGLLIFGVISFLSLLEGSTDAPLAKAWADALTSVFGIGSLLVSAGIFVLGIVILLPKINITISFPTHRLLALEVAFLTVLGMLHISSGDNELRAIARAGEGGGYIGWGVSVIPHWAFGSQVTMLLFIALITFCIGTVVGIKHKHISHYLLKAINQLKAFSERFAISATVIESTDKIGNAHALDTIFTGRSPANSIMRIRSSLQNLPPSQRQATISSGKELENVVENELDNLDETEQRLTKVLHQSLTSAPKEQVETQFSAVGELLPQKGKAPQMVQRPDGRIKRYYSVASMKEVKKTGRRPKSLPPLDLLQDIESDPPDEQEINRNVVLIENTLLEFDIDIDVVDVKVGPTVTQYAITPYRETKDGRKEITRLSKIAALANDLSLSLSTRRLRMETPVPGETYMGVEVPNQKPSIVTLRSVYESKNFYDLMQKAKTPLVVPLGRDVAGKPSVIDLAGMPHLLIAGTTGSGKSVCITALTISLIMNNSPDEVKLVMLDPKMVELARFNGLPHLVGPVETDIERIMGVLRWCTREMDRRYKLLEENAARNIEIFNSRLGQRRKKEHLPYMVIMVDEVGDLMMTKPEETEKTLTRLAQMARAVGMHMVVATQRPSVDVITGLIKANFPSRISFAVASSTDSRVILDSIGAETLLGKGDMLYLAPDASGPKRLQGCFVADEEVQSITEHWIKWYREQVQTGKMDPPGYAPWERGLTRREFLSETDPMLEDAIELVVQEQEASASQIQRKLGLGYPRAARIIDLLEELGVIGEPLAGGRSRKVLIEKGKDPFQEVLKRHSYKRDKLL